MLHPSARLLALVLVAGFVLRLAAAFWWESRLPEGKRFAFGDSDGYWRLGQAIARGDAYEYGTPDLKVFRTPGYPLLLAGELRIFGQDMPVIYARMLGAVLGTLALAAVYWLGAEVFSPAVGLWAAALVAIYPGAIGLSVYVLSEAPFCPLMVASLAALVRAYKQARRSAGAWAFVAGALSASAALMRPSWLLFLPAAVLTLLLSRAANVERMRIAVLSMVGLCVVMAPWWIRNWQVTGRFVPTTLQVGASLYDGLNPAATGASDMRFVEPFTQRERTLAGRPGEPFEVRLDRRFREAAVDWAKQHPARVAELIVIKVSRLWNVWPNAEEHRSALLRTVVFLSYTPLVLLAIAGLIRHRGLGWPLFLCLLPALYLTALHVVFVSSIRYREPAMLALAVPAAAMLYELILRVTKKTPRTEAARCVVPA